MANMVFANCISTTGAPLVKISNCTSSNGHVTMSKMVFKSNVNPNGTAAVKISSKCHLKLEKTSFIGNFGIIGSAVDISDGAEVTIKISRFRNNVASVVGGAVHVHGSSLFIDRCNFTQNSANSSNSVGGAVAAKVSACLDLFAVLNGNLYEQRKFDTSCNLPCCFLASCGSWLHCP